MERYLCIHGHFYQPPRENPWLDELELPQSSAAPFHDWNERINAECYAANASARIKNDKGKIVSIVNNYKKISFNFGPTLLNWMEKHSPEAYQQILDADKESAKERDGHGNAIAQVYNHIIMPLASRHDKITQIKWGIEDFKHRFKRFPEGMWLAETAVDMETLDLLAEAGIKFTILSPYQARRIKMIKAREWIDVSGAQIDPTLSYRCFLNNERYIDLFFYDGPISRSIAFEKILSSGDRFIERLMNGFNFTRIWPQFLNVATDGESYGHHFRFGEMGLAYALTQLEKRGLVKIMNYGECLARHPTKFEVEIIENTSWSCAHGIERWRSDCGCNSGQYLGGNQRWRTPLRKALNSLKETLDSIFEKEGSNYFKDPWEARNHYITFILNRTDEKLKEFFEHHRNSAIGMNGRNQAMKLLEMQRYGLLMFTSCGWFFDDIAGLEPVQLLKYAARAIELAKQVSKHGLPDIEEYFLNTLSQANSNDPKEGTGATLYKTKVLPLRANAESILNYYSISSLFKDKPKSEKVFCFNIDLKDYQKEEEGGNSLALGRVTITDGLIREQKEADFAILYTAGPKFYIYLDFSPAANFQKLKDYHLWKFHWERINKVRKNLEKDFELYSLNLDKVFLEGRIKIGRMINNQILNDFEKSNHQLYERYIKEIYFLNNLDLALPKGFLMAAECFLGEELETAVKNFIEMKGKYQDIINFINQAKKWGINIQHPDITQLIENGLLHFIESLLHSPFELTNIQVVNNLLDISYALNNELNLFNIQNVFFKIVVHRLPDLEQAEMSFELKKKILLEYRRLGERLQFAKNVEYS
ncbi:MAG: DUF3536 domain-containing protein [bacterium]